MLCVIFAVVMIAFLPLVHVENLPQNVKVSVCNAVLYGLSIPSGKLINQWNPMSISVTYIRLGQQRFLMGG